MKFSVCEMLTYENLKPFHLLLRFNKKRKGEETNIYCTQHVCSAWLYRGIILFILLKQLRVGKYLCVRDGNATKASQSSMRGAVGS